MLLAKLLITCAQHSGYNEPAKAHFSSIEDQLQCFLMFLLSHCINNNPAVNKTGGTDDEITD